MEDPPKNRIVFAGNPGVGKSTLLNSIIGHVAFRAGVSLGTGMTTVLANQVVGDTMYTDTPGLDDVQTREKAAKEISSALKLGGNIKLIFVMTLEAGRIRGVDMATMTQILEAIEKVEIDVNYRFSILVNKVSPRVLKQLENRNRVEVLFSQVNLNYRVGHATYLEFCRDADDADNHILEGKDRLLEFVEMAPFIKIRRGAEINVRADNYDSTLEEMNNRLRELERQKEERDRVIAKMQQEREEHFRMMDRERKEHNQKMVRVRNEHEREIAKMTRGAGRFVGQVDDARSSEIARMRNVLTTMHQQIQESNRMIIQERESRYKIMLSMQKEMEDQNRRITERQGEGTTGASDRNGPGTVATGIAGAGIGTLAGLAMTGACSVQ